MTIYSLDFLTINSGSYQGRFFSSDGMMKDFDSYSGIVGTANIKNTNMSFPLVIPVAAANNESNSQNTGNTGYLIAYEPFRMIFMSQPDPKVLVEVSPKILMVLGLVIYLGLDFIGSLVLLISYYGLYSVKTMALYLNSSFIILFYILLGPQFIAAAKFVWHNLLVWKLRDSILISSLLLTWPGLGFGYKSYNETDRYTWWSWYGWGSDVREVQFSQSGDNASESNWYICGFLSTIISLIYCEFSILLNTMPSNMIE
ncbi:hypothetical protein C2G38_2041550 [Gigaspora rosea]|uniref:Uncharacterized protein n=1 Tax=Gigaspora rosea TaxID=44941 RepID=A0A397URE3_9GLOM|nr:hypothetical protein C2G38_2041550 [Gigaspora rosea]